MQAQFSRRLVEVIEAAWTGLGLDVIADEAFFQLVLARLVEPTSMSDSIRVLDDLGIKLVPRNTFLATLRRCGQRGDREQGIAAFPIATACFNHTLTSGDVSLCLYDVTTFSFEASMKTVTESRLLQRTSRRPTSRGRVAGGPARVPT